MKKITFLLGILAIFIFLGYIGCDNGNTGDKGDTGNTGDETKIGKIGAKFVAFPNANANLNISRSLLDQNEEIFGMYFTTLNIVAYQYSPGFSTNGKNDWAYYIILNDTYYTLDDGSVTEARNIILLNGDEVDFAAINPYPYELSDQFKSEFDNFTVDFLEVNMSNPGVFFDNKFYGYVSQYVGMTQQDTQQEAFDALIEKYPDISSFSLYNFEFPYYANMQGFEELDVTFSVVFARADWFPEPVFVYLDSVDGNSFTSKTYTYNWSSKELTDHQKELLEGIAGYPAASWFRRSHIIIPYTYMYSLGNYGPIKLAVNEDAEGMINPVFNISFNFKQLLTDETYNNIINNGNWKQSQSQIGSNPVFTFRSNGGIPFGLTVNVIDEK